MRWLQPHCHRGSFLFQFPPAPIVIRLTRLNLVSEIRCEGKSWITQLLHLVHVVCRSTPNHLLMSPLIIMYTLLAYCRVMPWCDCCCIHYFIQIFNEWMCDVHQCMQHCVRMKYSSRGIISIIPIFELNGVRCTTRFPSSIIHIHVRFYGCYYYFGECMLVDWVTESL